MEAGKSTLKSLMKDSTIRKLLKNAELVKSIGTETQDDAEDAIDQRATDTLEAANIEISKELKEPLSISCGGMTRLEQHIRVVLPHHFSK